MGARLRVLWCVGLFALSFAAAPSSIMAQSLAPDMGSPLYDSNAVEGFNSQFVMSAGNLTNPVMHSGTSDPLHSTLDSTSLSPLVFSQLFQGVVANPPTDVVSDASAALSENGFGARRESRSFDAGADMVGAGAETGFRGDREAFGATLSRAELAVAKVGRAGLDRGTAQFGEIENASAEPADSVPASTLSMSATIPGGSYNRLGGDPVLTGSSAGYETGLELEGDMPLPSSETAGFYSSATVADPTNYAFDDGQTPGPGLEGPLPGAVRGPAPTYTTAANGFPDSTRGTAALPSELSNFSSPFSQANTNGSPFAPVSEGTVFGVHTGVNYSLYATPPSSPVMSFRTFERRIQAQRIASGLPISYADQAYEQDLRNYQRYAGRHERPSTLTKTTANGLFGPVQ